MISKEYQKQLEQLHQERPDFGTSSAMYAQMVKGMINEFKPEGLLDYGAGKQALKTALGIKDGYFAYDPAIPEIAAIPEPQDMVVCSDVLEHVEREYVTKVIQDLARVTKKIGFFVIHTGAAMAVLPDGRNAHITQEPASWWLLQLLDDFEPKALEVGHNGFWVVVTPKGK